VHRVHSRFLIKRLLSKLVEGDHTAEFAKGREWRFPQRKRSPSKQAGRQTPARGRRRRFLGVLDPLKYLTVRCTFSRSHNGAVTPGATTLSGVSRGGRDKSRSDDQQRCVCVCVCVERIIIVVVITSTITVMCWSRVFFSDVGCSDAGGGGVSSHASSCALGVLIASDVLRSEGRSCSCRPTGRPADEALLPASAPMPPLLQPLSKDGQTHRVHDSS